MAEKLKKYVATRNTVVAGTDVGIGESVELNASDARLMRNKVAAPDSGEAKAAIAAQKALAAADKADK